MIVSSKKKILIVDDEIDFVRILSTYLKARGYSTVSASDAVGAIMVAQRENPDFITLDVNMPAGNGFTVMERLAKFDRTSLIPVVVVTGKVLTGRQRAMAAGAVGFLTKPVDFDRLLTLIDNLLGLPVGAEQRESVYSLPESYKLDE